MSIELELQVVSEQQDVPSQYQFVEWVAAIPDQEIHEVVIRVVDEDEMRALNKQYRHQDKSTNVLSFPAELPDVVDDPLLGDVIICATVVHKEALEQHKSVTSHWAHMVVHGILHLQGYDHTDSANASIMEQLEIQILQTLGINNPYTDKTY